MPVQKEKEKEKEKEGAVPVKRRPRPSAWLHLSLQSRRHSEAGSSIPRGKMHQQEGEKAGEEREERGRAAEDVGKRRTADNRIVSTALPSI